MSGAHDSSHRRKTLSGINFWFRLGGLAFILFGSTLAIGSAHPRVALIAALVAILWSLSSSFRGTKSESTGLRIELVFLPFLLLAPSSWFQGLPLPDSWVKGISPRAYELQAQWYEFLRVYIAPEMSEKNSYFTLSLLPEASLRQGVFFLSYFLFGVQSANFARRFGILLIPRLIALSGVLLVFVTLLHGLLGFERLYGFYMPSMAVGRWQLSPILNPNSLSGYLNLGLSCCLALTLSSRVTSDNERKLAVLGGIFCAGASFATASRAGSLMTLFLLVGALTCVGPILKPSDSREGWKSWLRANPALLTLGIVLVCSFALAGLTLTPAYLLELFSADLSKFNLWVWGFEVSKDFPLVGTGAAALESVSALYRQDPGHHVYRSVEQFPLQLLIEHGQLIACICFATWIFTARKAFRGSCSIARMTTLGIVALLVQNLADVALELPSVMLALVALIGNRCAISKEPAGYLQLDWLGKWPIQNGDAFRKLLRPSAALGAVVAVGFLAKGALDPMEARLDTYHQVNRSSPEKAPAIAAAILEKVKAFPRDAYLAMMLSELVLKYPKLSSNYGSTLAWSARSIQLDPLDGELYLHAGRVLKSLKRDNEARIQLKIAAKLDPMLLDRIFESLQELGRADARWVDAVPEGIDGARLAERMLTWFPRPKERATIIRLLEQIERDGGRLQERVRVLRARILLWAIVEKWPSCLGEKRSGCVKNSEEIIRYFNSPKGKTEVKHRAHQAQWVVLKAELMVMNGQAKEAMSLLEERCAALQSEPCLRFLIGLGEKYQRAASKASLDSYIGISCRAYNDACWDAYSFVADYSARVANDELELHYREQLARRSDRQSDWEKLEQLASLQGVSSVVEAAKRHLPRDADKK